MNKSGKILRITLKFVAGWLAGFMSGAAIGALFIAHEFGMI